MSFSAHVLTLFPDMFPGPLGSSLAGKALEKGLWDLDVIDIRDFAEDKHRTVDDTPAGGGPGVTLFRTSWPTALSFIEAIKSLTTGSATSASSRAMRTSRKAALTSSSFKAPRPVSLSNIPLNLSVRFSNISFPNLPGQRPNAPVGEPSLTGVRPRALLWVSQI